MKRGKNATEPKSNLEFRQMFANTMLQCPASCSYYEAHKIVIFEERYIKLYFLPNMPSPIRSRNESHHCAVL